MTDFIIYFELLAFAGSLLALPVLWGEPHLRVFPFLLLFTCMVEAHQEWIRFEETQYNTLIYNIHLFVETLLYLFILYLSFARREYKTAMLLFGAVFIMSMVVTSLFFYPVLEQFNAAGLCTGAVLLVIGILLKFYDMLKSPVNYNFLRNPFFYMLFALLLFNVGSLPFFTMGNWLYYEMGQHDAFVALYQVISILNYILYGTYTVCFLWMRKTKLSYS